MKLTETERALLENINERYKYIARDESGDLYLYTKKPIKVKASHIYDIPDEESDFQYLNVPIHLFPNIKWSDEEPLQFRNDEGEFIL